MLRIASARFPRTGPVSHPSRTVVAMSITSCRINTGLGLLGIDGAGARVRVEAVLAYVQSSASTSARIRTVVRPDKNIDWSPDDEWHEMVHRFAAPPVPGTTYEERYASVGSIWRDMGIYPESDRPDTT
jgi:hypothetical protein